MSLEAVIVFDDGSLQIDFARFEAAFEGEPIILISEGVRPSRDADENLRQARPLRETGRTGARRGPNAEGTHAECGACEKKMKWFAPIVPAQDGYRFRSLSR